MNDNKYLEFSERFNNLMKKNDFSIRDVSSGTKINYEMIRRYANGLAKPREEKMKLLADFLKTTVAYLDYGETSTQRQNPLANMKRAIDDPHSLSPALRDHFLAEHEDDPIDTDDAKAMLKRYVPVLSWVAAGDMTPVVSASLEDVLDWIPRPAHLSSQAFGLIVQGRSMLPKFEPGDIIYVEPEVNPWSLKDGDLIVVSCDDDREATFKQLVIGDTRDDMYLKPLNPDWHNQEIRPMEGCRLVGKVVGKYVMF